MLDIMRRYSASRKKPLKRAVIFSIFECTLVTLKLKVEIIVKTEFSVQLENNLTEHFPSNLSKCILWLAEKQILFRCIDTRSKTLKNIADTVISDIVDLPFFGFEPCVLLI